MNNRPERPIFFLVVWLTMFSFGQAYGQKPAPNLEKANFLIFSNDFRALRPKGKNGLFNALPMAGDRKEDQQDVKKISLEAAGYMYAQAPDLYYKQSGFFCKREWELEKITGIPFRFRLGSLADCNAMEGKH